MVNMEAKKNWDQKIITKKIVKQKSFRMFLSNNISDKNNFMKIIINTP